MTRVCAFCSAMGSDRHSLSETPLAKSRGFVAWPSLGAIVPGWTLVVPETHILALASLGPKRLRELHRFSASVRSKVERAFGPTVLFEHGSPVEGHEVGCGVDHAHLHVVPFRGSPNRSLRRLLPPGTISIASAGVSAAAEYLTQGLPYLFVEDQNRSGWLFVHPRIPSQAMRRVIAMSAGKADYFNWRDHPFVENVRATVATLSGA